MTLARLAQQLTVQPQEDLGKITSSLDRASLVVVPQRLRIGMSEQCACPGDLIWRYQRPERCGPVPEQMQIYRGPECRSGSAADGVVERVPGHRDAFG